MNLKHYGKHEALKQVEEKIDALQEELDDIPVIQEFKESQMEVNALLQLVAHTISNQVTDEIILSTGGDLLLGETGSKVKNSSPSCSINEKTPQMRVFAFILTFFEKHYPFFFMLHRLQTSHSPTFPIFKASLWATMHTLKQK